MTTRSLAACCRTASRQAGHSLAECALIVSFLSALTVAIISVLGPQMQAFGSAVVYAIRVAWHSV